MRIRTLMVAALATLLVTGVWLLPLRGTTLVRMSLGQLVQASSAVVRGRPIAQVSRWNAAHTEIETVTTVAVEQPLKGSPPATIIILQLGGRVGNRSVRVAGSVPFRFQTSYVLFLEPVQRGVGASTPEGTEGNPYLVVGMMQGAYRIYEDSVTHEERVIQPLGGATPISRGGNAATSGTMPLSLFQQQLSTALHAPLLIPAGTRLTVVIAQAEAAGAGRLSVAAQTTQTIYPNANAIVPLGSEVDGNAQLVDGTWEIHWNELSVRGRRAAIHAVSKVPSAGKLQGVTLVVQVR